jgi:hypothetical protein
MTTTKDEDDLRAVRSQNQLFAKDEPLFPNAVSEQGCRAIKRNALIFALQLSIGDVNGG